MGTRLPQFLLFLAFLLSTLLFSCPTTDNQYTVSKEIYNKTFNEIHQFFIKMDEIIKTGNFEQWKANLTVEYITLYSDAGHLRELSKKPNLKDRNIVITSLHDYFVNVFIPSRSGSDLDKIEIISKNRVKAIRVINDVPYIVYLLEKDENNQWKISVW
jgi:hypothetical protein